MTTDSQHTQPVATITLERDFTAPAPNSKWLAGIAAIWTAEGWLYLAAILSEFRSLRTAIWVTFQVLRLHQTGSSSITL